MRRDGTLTKEADAEINDYIKKNYEQASEILKKAKPGQRATMLKRYNRDGKIVFDSDGSLNKDFSLALEQRLNGAKVVYRDENGEKHAVDAPDKRYYSEGLVGDEARIMNELAKNGTKIYSGELDDVEQTNFNKVKAVHAALTDKGLINTELVLSETMIENNGYLDGRTVVIGKDKLTDGGYVDTVIHEVAHFTEGSAEYKAYAEHIIEQVSDERITEIAELNGIEAKTKDELIELVRSSDKPGKDTLISELVASESARLFDSDASVRRLARSNEGLARKILNRIRDFIDVLLAKTPDERAAIKQLMKQERLFEAALRMQGREYAEKHFAQMKREAEKEANSQTSENLDADERDASTDADDAESNDDIQRSAKPRSTDAKKELDDNSDLGYNKIKKTSTGDLSNEQNSKDPGLLVHGREASAVSGSRNDQRKQGIDSATSSGQMAGDEIRRNDLDGKSGHQGKTLSWLSGKRFVSQASVDRFRETLLRNRTRLNSNDVTGRPVPKKILQEFKDTLFTDENGSLLVLYHWTPNKFKVFAFGEIGFHFGTYEAAYGIRDGKSETERGADIYKEVYINIKKPILMDDPRCEWDAYHIALELWKRGFITKEHRSKISQMKGYNVGEYNDPATVYVRQLLKDLGFDGIIYENMVEDKGSLSVIALYPEQIHIVTDEKASDTIYNELKNEKAANSTENEASRKVQYSRKRKSTISEVLDREAVMSVFYDLATSDHERDIVTTYREELTNIHDKLNEIEKLKQRLDALEEKKKHENISEERARLKEEIRFIEEEISRRDQRLLELAAAKPLRDLVTNAYKKGISDGKQARFSKGAIEQIRAEIEKSVTYTYRAAKNAVVTIFDGYDVEERIIRELSNELWERLNRANNVKEQTDTVREFTTVVLSTLDKKTKIQTEEYRKLKQLKSYAGRIFFAREEMAALRKFHKDKAAEVLHFWEYRPYSDLAPYNLEKLVNKYKELFPQWKNLNKSNKTLNNVDFLMKINEVLEDLEKAPKHKYFSRDLSPAELKEWQNKTVDVLLDTFRHGGKETYKTKYERIQAVDSLLYAISQLRDFKKGRFVNSSNLKTDVFKRSIDELLRLQYRGHIVKSDTRGKIVAFKEWYDANAETFFGEGSGCEALRFDELSAWIDEIASGDGELTTSEIERLTDIIAYFTHIEQSWNKIWVDGQLVELAPIVDDFYQKAVETSEIPHGVIYKGLQVLQENPLARTVLQQKQIAQYEDGGVDGFNTFVFDKLQQAEIEKKLALINFLKPFEDFGKKHKGYLEEASKRFISFRGTELKLASAWELYMQLKDEDSALGYILNGYRYYNRHNKFVHAEGFFPNLKEEMIAAKTYSKEKLKKKAIELAKALARELEGLFTPEDLEFIKLLEHFYNVEGRELKRKRDIERFGISSIKEKGRYHHPLSRDGIAYTVGGFQINDKGKAATLNKHRTEDAQQPLFVGSAIKVLEKYMNDILNYAFVSPVRDTYLRLLDYNRNQENPNRPDKLRDKLRNGFSNARYVKKHGDSKTTAMDNFWERLFEDVEGGRKRRRSELEDAIRGNIVKSLLAVNPKTILNQFTSMFSAMSILNPVHFSRGFGHMTGDIDKYSKLAKIRHVEDGAFAALANVDAKNKFFRGTDVIGDVGMLGVSGTDRLNIRVLWGAAQVQVNAEQKLAFGSEENLKAAGALLDKVILETQQNALSTTKSAAMKSDSFILRNTTPFTADMNANISKEWGHLVKGSQLLSRAKYKETLAERLSKQDTEEAKKLAEQAKKDAEELRKLANKEFKDFGKTTAALLTTAVLGALIALLFRWFYHRKDDEETAAETFKLARLDFYGNLIGGIPVIKDIYSLATTGFGVEDMTMSALNDATTGLVNFAKIIGDINNDNLDERETARRIREVTYSVAHMLGIPIRNAYNVVYGIIGFNGEVKYKWDDFFYKQSYSADLARAIEAEDEDMIATITGIMTGERVGSIKDKRSLEVMNKLAGAGQDVIPRSIGDTMTVDGVEYSLTNTQKSEFKTIYGDANEALADLVKLSAFGKASEDVQAKAIKRVYDTYYQLAQVEVLGTAQTKATLFSKVIDVEELALIVAYANSIEADTDKSGKAISGSRRLKIERYVQSLGCTAAEKYMIMGYLGYKNKNGEERVKSLISRYRLPKAERDALLKYCGY